MRQNIPSGAPARPEVIQGVLGLERILRLFNSTTFFSEDFRIDVIFFKLTHYITSS